MSSDARRGLGLPELVAMGVGGMIGGGIFSMLGLATEVAGHAAPLSFLVGSVVALVAGYSYVKLALAFRSDGASFTYLEHAWPRHLEIAGIAGWTVVIGYVGTLALYAFTFGAYAAHLLGMAGSGGARSAFGLGILGVFAAVNLAGAGAMGKAEDAVVYLKLLLLAILAAAGFAGIQSDRLQPLVDRGIPSVFLGGALIFVAYEGFQLITNAVVEAREPERDLPRGIYMSIGITSAVYVAIALVAVGNLDLGALAEAREYALAVVARPVLGRAGVVMVDVAALLATASAVNATLFGASRLASEMATERLAPHAFSFRNRSEVPAVGVAATALAGALFTATGGLELIAAFSSMTFLLVSIGVTLANLRLRERTGSRLWPVVAGLVLMFTTVVLLVLDLARNDLPALGVILAIYAGTALLFGAFERARRG